MKDRFLYLEEPDQAIAVLGSDRSRGLTEEEAVRRQALYGRNTLPKEKKGGVLFRFFQQFTNPLVYFLLAAAVATFCIGGRTDAFVILAVVIANAVIGLIQEGRAAHALDALRSMAIVHTRVLRAGKTRTLVSEELVPGDVLCLSAGDGVPADARIIDAQDLQVIESALTGEAHEVTKTTEKMQAQTPFFARENMLYMGTHIVKGRCVALVAQTGSNTEFGKIALLAKADRHLKTPIETRIDTFGKRLGGVAGALFVLLLWIGWLRGIPFVDIFAAAISQLVSLLPEGLPAAITVALAVGVQRMASRGAVIRRLVAVETLGATTVICVDKTGTLTKNIMTVKEIWMWGEPPIEIEGVGYASLGGFRQNGQIILPAQHPLLMTLLKAGVLCNDAGLDTSGAEEKVLGDPTEGALLVVAKKGGVLIETMRASYPRHREIPFDPSKKYMATWHSVGEGEAIYMKGAVERVLMVCQYVATSTEGTLPLTLSVREQIIKEAASRASEGFRVLAFAQFSQESPESLRAGRGAGEFLGLMCQMDPPRNEIKDAVQVCHAGGIRVVMITGDHIATAKAIATQVGIFCADSCAVSGSELDAMSEEQLAAQIDRIAVFARVHPEQKLRIVQALQKKGEIVVMTGDGVNDAPALACAHVGVAMGITGTDVAKESAKMVIMDDNFATIVQAVEQGRLIYANIKKVVVYVLSTSIGMVAFMELAIALGYPLPLSAVQVLWINVVTEGTVTINLILEPPEGKEMRGRPPSSHLPIFHRGMISHLACMVPVMTLLLLGYCVFRSEQMPPLPLLRTEIFTLLVFCAWCKAISVRSATRSAIYGDFLRNRYLAIGLGLSILLQGAVLYLPPLQDVFHTVSLSPGRVLSLFCLGTVVLWSEELRKVYLRRQITL